MTWMWCEIYPTSCSIYQGKSQKYWNWRSTRVPTHIKIKLILIFIVKISKYFPPASVLLRFTILRPRLTRAGRRSFTLMQASLTPVSYCLNTIVTASSSLSVNSACPVILARERLWKDWKNSGTSSFLLDLLSQLSFQHFIAWKKYIQGYPE